MCEYGTIIKSGLQLWFNCEKCGGKCPFVRWCSPKNTLIMIDSYKNCKIRTGDIDNTISPF